MATPPSCRILSFDAVSFGEVLQQEPMGEGVTARGPAHHETVCRIVEEALVIPRATWLKTRSRAGRDAAGRRHRPARMRRPSEDRPEDQPEPEREDSPGPRPEKVEGLRAKAAARGSRTVSPARRPRASA
jgi:hypothetical protein